MNHFVSRPLKPETSVSILSLFRPGLGLLLLIGAFCMMIYVCSAKGLTFNGPTNHPKISLRFPEKTLDYHRLARAIACAETSCGKDGTAIHRNNCCGIMRWDSAGRHAKYFDRYEDSLAETARIWEQYYVRFPDLALATKWTGNDHPERWLGVVQSVYASR